MFAFSLPFLLPSTFGLTLVTPWSRFVTTFVTGILQKNLGKMRLVTTSRPFTPVRHPLPLLILIVILILLFILIFSSPPGASDPRHFL